MSKPAPPPDEDMRRRVVRLSCADTDDGVPECYGAAGMGPERCTCPTIPAGEHDEAVLVAWVHYHQRGGRACHDCAFRRGSPEEESGAAEEILAKGGPFYCHQGMPVDARGGPAELGEYEPDDHTRYPPCAGWLAMRLRDIGRAGGIGG